VALKRYRIAIQHVEEIDVLAPDIATAERVAKDALLRLPETSKLMSVLEVKPASISPPVPEAA
jgi:hypothetical protein